MINPENPKRLSHSIKRIQKFSHFSISLILLVGFMWATASIVFIPSARGDSIEEGASLFSINCAMCHHTESTERKVGPGLQRLFTRDKLPVSGLPVTEDNIRKQIKTPVGTMPSFAKLSEIKISHLIEFLKTL
ncbi:MAG: cytochrome c [Desulfobacterales bacterium]|nr:cytochrome c [Desulfobacterales bacterium]